MTKTLVKHGNSYALVIDKPILDLLQATPETPFEILTDGQALILRPIREPDSEERFRAALERVNQQFGRTLKHLAE